MTDSITSWLFALRRGDSAAASRLWDRYFQQLLGLARYNLRHRTRTCAVDEEDVAATVLGELFVKLMEGGHHDVENRDDLWQLLVVITIRKATTIARRENRLKRGQGRVLLESQIGLPGQFRLDDLTSKKYVAALSDFMSQQCRILIEALDDAELEKIALWKLAGHTNDEIARKLNCTRVTIQRRLRLVRKIWDAETDGLATAGVPGAASTHRA